MVAKHYDGSKILRQGLWNTLFSWGENSQEISTLSELQFTTALVNCYVVISLLRQGPLGTRVALHVSQQTSSESWAFSGVAAVSRYTPPPPLKGPVAPVALQLPGVSHVKLPLKRCRAPGRCSSYTCRCRATLCTPTSRDVLTQVAGHPGHALSKQKPLEGALHKAFVGVL